MNFRVLLAITMVIFLLTLIEGRRKNLKKLGNGLYLVHFGLFSKIVWFIIGIVIPTIIIWKMFEDSPDYKIVTIWPYLVLFSVFFFGAGYQFLSVLFEKIELTPSNIIMKSIGKTINLEYSEIKYVSYDSKKMMIVIENYLSDKMKYSPQMVGHIAFLKVLSQKLPKDRIDDSIFNLISNGA
jgi:hypothetical protein